MKTLFLILMALPFNVQAVTEVCVEEPSSQYEGFVMLNFDKERTTTGIDQILPVKNKIQEFITANPNIILTELRVVSSSAKIPFYKISAGKKVYDPQSDEKNKGLALERAIFAEKVLSEFKIPRKVTHALAGPDFQPLDLNTRFVTKMTPEYEKKVNQLFEENKEIFQKEAAVNSSAELLDEAKFSNLYQAKYRPFHGFRISLTGYKKCKSKTERASSPSGKIQ